MLFVWAVCGVVAAVSQHELLNPPNQNSLDRHSFDHYDLEEFWTPVHDSHALPVQLDAEPDAADRVERAAAVERRVAPVSVAELLALPLSALLERAGAEGLDKDTIKQLMDDTNPHDALALALHQLLTMQVYHPSQPDF